MFRLTTQFVVRTAVCVALIYSSQAHTSGQSEPALLSASHVDGAHGRPSAANSVAGDVRAAYLRTPLRFERPFGDRSAADFVARGLGYGLSLHADRATLTLAASSVGRPAVITMRLLEGGRGAEAVGLDELPGHTNHFVGSDARLWQKRIRTFARVQYRNVYPGVDVIYYGTQRQLEYDFVVAPGASPSAIAFKIEGAEDIAIDRRGDLIVSSSAGETIHRAPIAYQEKYGKRHLVPARFSLDGDGRVSFRLGRYDKRSPLVIDPVLSYSTYLGGSQQERVNAVVVHAQGDVFVVGETFSSDFPTTTGESGRSSGGDVFVARLSAAGDVLRYVTYLGGQSSDLGTAVRTDVAGNLYVSGATFSWDFPTTDGFQPAHNGQSDGFVAKLDENGQLVYSTLLGGTQEDYANGIAVDVAGRVYIAGHTQSADFPVVSGLQPSLGGNPALTSADGGYTWTGMKTGLNVVGVRTFAIDPVAPAIMYAGTESEGVFVSKDAGSTWIRTADLPAIPVNAFAVADDGSGTVYVANDMGLFRSSDAGVTWTSVLWGSATSVAVERGSPSTVYVGVGPNSYPAGVLKSIDGGETWAETGLAIGITAMAASGSTVYAATVNGLYRSGPDGGWMPVPSGLFADVWTLAADPVDPATAYVGTSSGLFKTTSGGAEWVAVWEFMDAPTISVAIAPSDPSTVYVTTWFGSTVTTDGGLSWIPISSADNAGGIVVHPNVPTTIYAASRRGFDAFVATLSSDGSHLEYSTFFGGSSHEQVTDIAIDSQGGMYVAGTTHSRDLPVLNAVQPQPGDLMDVFVAKVAPDGSLAYATYLAGWQSDYAARIDVDALGCAYITGLTWSANFPVANAFQPTLAGGFSDVFLSVLNPSGKGFVYSTFLGGSDMENDATQSLGPDIAVTSAGDAYVSGSTMSRDFPTTPNGFQRAHRGGTTDAFVTKFDPAGQLRYSTFLGGAEGDYVRAIALDADGVTVAGWTDSPNWPIRDGLQAHYGGLEDGFIATIQEVADSTPPHTTVRLSGTAGSGGWYRSAVEVVLSANDGHDGSGVRLIRYSVDGGTLQSYNAPFTVHQEGTTSVVVQAVDNAGNVEQARTTLLRIDTTAPSLRIASPEARDYLHSETAVVSVSASDDVSGIAGPPAITLDGSPIQTTNVALFSLPLGAHTLTLAAVDAAGNHAQQSVTLRIVATVDSLIATVQAYGGDMKTSARNSLLAKLNETRAALERGQVNQAANRLHDIVDYCTRESGDAISQPVAALLVTDAQFVLGTLSVPSR